MEHACGVCARITRAELHARARADSALCARPCACSIETPASLALYMYMRESVKLAVNCTVIAVSISRRKNIVVVASDQGNVVHVLIDELMMIA